MCVCAMCPVDGGTMMLVGCLCRVLVYDISSTGGGVDGGESGGGGGGGGGRRDEGDVGDGEEGCEGKTKQGKTKQGGGRGTGQGGRQVAVLWGHTRQVVCLVDCPARHVALSGSLDASIRYLYYDLY